MEPTIGVVIPVYNGAAFVDQAMASLAGQQRSPDAIIVVDDASTDDTVALVEAWQDQLPVRVLRQSVNQGPAVARRLGAEALESELIALIDIDDLFFPDHLSSAIAIYERDGGAVIGDWLDWRPGHALAGRSWLQKHPLPPVDEQYDALLNGYLLAISGVIERSAFLAVGSARSGRSAEDWDVWVRLARAGVPIRATAHPTWLYRQDGADVMKAHRMGTPWVRERLAALQSVLEECGGQNEPVAARAVLRAERRLRLYEAFDHARDGRMRDARKAARDAIPGDARVRVRAIAVAIAPGMATKAYDAARRRRSEQLK